MATNAIQTVGQGEWQTMLSMADVFVKSGFLPQSIKTPAQAVTIIMAGRPLGIDAWTALQNINVIQSKPTISPQLMLALINGSGLLEDMTIEGNEALCTVTMKRRGRTVHEETFSMADANAMGLAGKDNYKKQPATMLKWRAVAACARVVFPDVILGLYTPDEMGADVRVLDDGAMEIIRDDAPEVMRDWPAIFKAVESDFDEVTEQARKAHWWNLTKAMIEAGTITDTLTDTRVIEVIKANRQQKALEAVG